MRLFGASQAHDAAFALETMGSQKQLQSCEQAYSELRKEMDRITPVLTHFVA